MSARSCQWCGDELTSPSPRARYCDSTCRSRASRARSAGAEEIPEEPPAKQQAKKSTAAAAKPKDDDHPFVSATRRELDTLEAADTMLGHQVLTIAERMGRGAETGAAMASLSKEHSRLMGDIRSRAKGKDEDPVEAARRKRDEKAARAQKA